MLAVRRELAGGKPVILAYSLANPKFTMPPALDAIQGQATHLIASSGLRSFIAGCSASVAAFDQISARWRNVMQQFELFRE
jgi:hypothetical protein